MPNTKISADPTGTTLTGTEVIPILQSATNKKTTINSIIKDLDIPRFHRTGGVIDGFLDWNDVSTTGGTEVDSWADLLTTYPAASNTGEMVLVRNCADNLVGIPLVGYCDGIRWRVIGGQALLAKEAPNLSVTSAAATWVGTYTITDAGGANAGKVKIASAGIHSLTTGVVINANTALNAYICVTATTGGTVPWSLQLVRIIEVTDTLTLVLDYPYHASLGQPTFALANTEFEVRRLNVPALYDTGMLTWDLTVDNTGTNSKRSKIKFGAAGVSVASASSLYDTNDTTAATLRVMCGLENTGGVTNSQILFHSNATTSGSGSGAAAPTITSIQTNVATQVLITALITVANDMITFSRYSFYVSP